MVKMVVFTVVLTKPKTIEQELAEENRRLRAEVAYLKKLRALEAAKRARGRNAR